MEPTELTRTEILKKIAAQPDLCRYGHHETHGKPMSPCEACGGATKCGPFHHWCPACHPWAERRCLICNQKVGYCCC